LFSFKRSRLFKMKKLYVTIFGLFFIIIEFTGASAIERVASPNASLKSLISTSATNNNTTKKAITNTKQKSIKLIDQGLTKKINQGETIKPSIENNVIILENNDNSNTTPSWVLPNMNNID